ncbi:Syntenin-1 [Manis javanica]|nr:Syntenin-1 [Manis javanica]
MAPNIQVPIGYRTAHNKGCWFHSPVTHATAADLKVDKVIQAQTAFSANPANPAILSEASAPISQDGSLYPKLYPELSQYMGLSLNEEEIHANMAMVPGTQVQGLVARPSSMNYMVASVTGNDVGIRRAEIK